MVLIILFFRAYIPLRERWVYEKKDIRENAKKDVEKGAEKEENNPVDGCFVLDIVNINMLGNAGKRPWQ